MPSYSRNKPRILSTLQLLMCALTLLVFGCHRSASPPVTTTKTTTTSATSPNAPLDKLLGLMNDRLALMHDVAKWKWNEDKPIADPQREQSLLDQLRSKAADYKLDPDLVESFFRAQIEAAKQMQQEDFDAWNASQAGRFADAPDLATVLRPRIDRLNEQLLAALAEVAPLFSEADFPARTQRRANETLAGDGVTSAVRKQAIEPLLSPAKKNEPRP